MQHFSFEIQWHRTKNESELQYRKQKIAARCAAICAWLQGSLAETLKKMIIHRAIRAVFELNRDGSSLCAKKKSSNCRSRMNIEKYYLAPQKKKIDTWKCRHRKIPRSLQMIHLRQDVYFKTSDPSAETRNFQLCSRLSWLNQTQLRIKRLMGFA